MKTCLRCNETKSITEFFLLVNKQRYSYCKSCNKIMKKEYYTYNLEENRLKRKAWQKENPNRHKFHQRMYYARKRENKTWGILID